MSSSSNNIDLGALLQLVLKGRSGIVQIFSAETLSQPERDYLCSVYTLLCGGIICTALGSGVGIAALQSGWLGTSGLGLIGFVGMIAASLYTASQRRDRATSIEATFKDGSGGQILGIGASSFSLGIALSSILLAAAILNVSIIVTSFMASIVIFGSMSFAAIYAPRRHFMALGAIAGSIMGYVLLGSLIQMFFPTQVMYTLLSLASLLGGLLYTLHDTQYALESFRAGQADLVRDALRFYSNFVRIFIEILSILLQKESEKQRQQERRNSDKRSR